MRFRGVLLVLPLCFGTALADEVVLKNGSTIEGRIVEETDAKVSIDVGAGVMTFERSAVERIVHAAQSSTSDNDDARPSPRAGVPQAIVGDLAASVGEGGVTRKELADRVSGYTRGDSTLDDLSPEKARTYLDPLIDEELLFQGAMADGSFDDPAVRRRLCEAQLSAQGVGTGLARVSDQELRAWYDAHPKELTEARRLQVCGARLYDAADLATAGGLEETKKRTDTLRAAGPNDAVWDFKGWIGQEEEFLGPRTYEMLKTLRVGDCSNDIACSDNSVWAFRVLAREDFSSPPPFEECRDRVRLMVAMEREGALQAGATDEVFRAALDAGLHRNSYHRAFIIERYVESRKRTRADLLVEMRERFPVTVRLGE